MYAPTPAGATPGTLRSRFGDDSLETMAGHRVVVLCFERLVRDCDVALAAMERADHDATNTALRHAQDLLGEVVAMLDVDAWEHGSALLSVYDYLLRRLALSNVTKDPAGVAEARRLLGELGEAFAAASAEISAPAPGAPAARAATPIDADDDARPRLSVRA